MFKNIGKNQIFCTTDNNLIDTKKPIFIYIQGLDARVRYKFTYISELYSFVQNRYIKSYFLSKRSKFDKMPKFNFGLYYSGKYLKNKKVDYSVYDITPGSFIDIRDFNLDWSIQSSVQQSNTAADNVIDQVTLTFDDENAGEVTDIPSDIQTENPYVSKNSEIEHFLKRPVNITSYSWTLGSTTPAQFEPWTLFFNHPSIKKKLDNYYLLRCKLNVKFVINASPFHFGCMLAAYKPLLNYLLPARVDTTLLSADAANVGLSQLPRVYIYPQASQGGVMQFPFLFPKEWLNATSSAAFDDMGTVLLRPITPLQFANAGVGTPITIQVYAWAEDITLSGPTVKLALQSGIDEYQSSGAISAPASAIANVAGLLENVPIIGKYATATKMIAGAVGKVASFFGFTNVPVIKDVPAFIPNALPQLASPEIGIQLEKLTMDPKNELTIDPTSVGIDLKDELLISSFVSRETYLTQFPWLISNAPDTILFSTRITPTMLRVESGINQQLIQGTPMWLVSSLFSYWRGDIKIRFKFICSQYHRGRVRISWDPVGAIGSTVDTSTEVYTKIVDLAKCSDIEINVPFMQDTAFLSTDQTIQNNYANDGTMVHIPGSTNGVLTVRVLNDLSAPLSTSNIQVLVFVAGNDNLSFSCPSDPDLTKTICAYPVQTSIENYDTEMDVTEMAMEPSNPPGHLYLNYHGEVIKSLRQLFRRTVFTRFSLAPSSLITSTSAGATVIHRTNRYPLYPGFNVDGSDVSTGLTSGLPEYYNWVSWTPVTWISQCFLGVRGSMHWRVNPLNRSNNYYSSLRILRSSWDTNRTIARSLRSLITSTTTTNTFARNSVINYDSEINGVSITNQRTQSALNVSLPFYSKYKFRTTTALTNTNGSSEDDSNLDWFQISYDLTPSADNAGSTTNFSGAGISMYSSAGTDFSPIFFVNVPTLYKYSSIPVSNAGTPA
jgi:hypothetical protein